MTLKIGKISHTLNLLKNDSKQTKKSKMKSKSEWADELEMAEYFGVCYKSLK